MSLPAALIVDDGSPVNIGYWYHPAVEGHCLFPNSFVRQFGQVCAAHGARGKFSVLPMPAGLGRIDRQLRGVPAGHLRGFLSAVRQTVAPNFDITPEFLTHGPTVDLGTGRFRHFYEDVFADQAGVAEMTDYFSFAFAILKNAGLPGNGVTSPWMAGIKNERRYAEAIARATWRVHRRKLAWYFLHICQRVRPRWPWVSWRDRRRGLACVSVPANTTDPFWPTQDAASRRGALAAAEAGADNMLSRDGKTGRLRQVYDAGCPLVLLTHWQSLYSRGRRAGLAGLERLFERVNRLLPDLAWMRCSELARLVATAPGRSRAGCRPGRGRSPA